MHGSVDALYLRMCLHVPVGGVRAVCALCVLTLTPKQYPPPTYPHSTLNNNPPPLILAGARRLHLLHKQAPTIAFASYRNARLARPEGGVYFCWGGFIVVGRGCRGGEYSRDFFSWVLYEVVFRKCSSTVLGDFTISIGAQSSNDYICYSDRLRRLHLLHSEICAWPGGGGVLFL